MSLPHASFDPGGGLHKLPVLNRQWRPSALLQAGIRVLSVTELHPEVVDLVLAFIADVPDCRFQAVDSCC